MRPGFASKAGETSDERSECKPDRAKPVRNVMNNHKKAQEGKQKAQKILCFLAFSCAFCGLSESGAQESFCGQRDETHSVPALK